MSRGRGSGGGDSTPAWKLLNILNNYYGHTGAPGYGGQEVRRQVPQKDLPRYVHGITDCCKSGLEKGGNNNTVIVTVSKPFPRM